MQAHIPASLLIPEHRLLHLLAQAREHQLSKNLSHNSSETSFSLLHDYNFSRSDVPTHQHQVLRQHTDEVWFVRFSCCGRFLASASKDTTVMIWDATGTTVVPLHSLGGSVGHTQAVSYVAWHPNQARLLTCSKDHQIRLWDAERGTLLHVYKVHTMEVQSCEWFPDGERFASTGLDKKLHVSHAQEGHVLHTWESDFVVYDIVVLADGSIAGTCSDRQLRIFSMDRLQSEAIPEKSSVTSIALSTDRRHALVNLCSQEVGLQEIHLWDMQTRTLAFTFQGHTQNKYVIRSAFGGNNEAFVVSGSEDKNIYIWHRERGMLLGTLSGHGGMVNSVAWNPMNPFMIASASDDHTIRIWVSEKLKVPPVKEA